MKINIIFAVLLILSVAISTFALVISPNLADFDIKREKKNFILDQGQNYYVFNRTIFNIHKLIITLSFGTTFNVSYKITGDTPIIFNGTFTTKSTFTMSAVTYFKIISPLNHIEGEVEIDYAFTGSYD